MARNLEKKAGYIISKVLLNLDLPWIGKNITEESILYNNQNIVQFKCSNVIESVGSKLWSIKYNDSKHNSLNWTRNLIYAPE